MVNSRGLIAGALGIIFLIVMAGLAAHYSQPNTGEPVQTVESVPPVATTVVSYGCSVVSQPPPQGSGASTTSNETASSEAYPSAFSLVNTTGGVTQLYLNVSSDVSFDPVACSYTYTDISYPVECGVTCGNGIRSVDYLTYLWEMNFSLISQTDVTGQELTITPVQGQLSGLMPEPDDEISVGSSPVTWYSTPPCSNGVIIESDCFSQGASSITIALPPVENGAYQLVINSTGTSA